MRRTGQAIIAALSLVGVTVATVGVTGSGVAGAAQHQAIAAQHGAVKVSFTAPGRALKAVVPTPSDVRYAVRRLVSQKTGDAVGVTGTTVPLTNYNITAGQNGQNYTISIVGGNVTTGTGSTAISAEVIPVIFTFTATGDVYNPTVQNASCGETQSAVSGMLNGPELKSRRWYAGKTYVGNGVYTDAQMREEFWTYTNPDGASPNWNLVLNGHSTNGFDVSVASSVGTEVDTGTCNAMGEIDYNSWDSFMQSTLIPDAVTDYGVGPTTLPIFEFKNVVMTQNSGSTCCILGYHSSYVAGGNTQTYAVTDYVTDGQFGSTEDLASSSHEIAEWANDPFGNNPVPPWGHIGQQPNCQGNLEVGDPLSGTVFTVQPPTPGGQVYHLQELAFLGWFYDSNLGVNGWYSTRGTFTSGATLCS